MPWYPGYEQRYMEIVPGNVVHALGREYEEYSVPSSYQYIHFPNTIYYDVLSDSLLVYPQLQSYEGAFQQYYDEVISAKAAAAEREREAKHK